MIKRNTFKFIIVLLLSAVIINTVSWAADTNMHERRVIIAVLRLAELWHYRLPKLDDKLSANFYNKYLSNLDSDKLYFVQKTDLEELKQYQLQLDDELVVGSTKFMEITDELLQKRLNELQGIITELTAKPFDYYANEVLKTKYSTYASDMPELKERWRRVLKFHALERYVKLLEAKEPSQRPIFGKVDSKLEHEARSGVANEFRQRLLRRSKMARDEKFSEYLNSLLDCYDPHTEYIAKTQESFEKISYVHSAVLRASNGSPKFGYISIPYFYHDGKALRNVALDVRSALNGFDDVAGVVLDLRDNPGGVFSMALDVAGLFLRNGPLIQLANAHGEIELISDNSELVSRLPLVVLVNSQTASSAEVLAAIFQDYERAVIVGSVATYGKGTAQSYFDVGEFMLDKYEVDQLAGTLKLTCEQCYRLNGLSFQSRGIRSDIILPELNWIATKTVEEQLDFAISPGSVKPVSYQRWRNEHLEKLRQRSLKRLQEDTAFQSVNAINRYQRETENYNEQSIGLKRAIEIRNKKYELNAHYRNSLKHRGKIRIISEIRDVSWQKELRSDIYVEEALRVLEDMLTGKWF